ncbi:hypothetical protein Hanom_Chr16g01481941 [Helianthus anomalus]
MVFETEAGIGLMHFQKNSVDHPNGQEFASVMSHRLKIEWATVGNSVDCGVFAMRHMETWFGVTKEKWDSDFPLTLTEKKVSLILLWKSMI